MKKMKNGNKAEVVAHSVDKYGNELISVLCTFPRIILAEVNTHRMLSKNTSSSRAIPLNKTVESVETNPFIPIAWQKEHKGMQGSEYLTGPTVGKIKYQWLSARDEVVKHATALNKGSDVTKQLCNRLLEPFMWTTMLITGPKSGWDNFFNLRNPQYKAPSNSIETANLLFKSKKDMIDFYVENGFKIGAGALRMWTPLDWMKVNQGQAEIHIMDLAEKIYDAVNESTPEQLSPGMWHIPFLSKIDSSKLKGKTGKEVTSEMIKISTALSARTSYTVVGDEKEIDYQKMIELHDRLIQEDPPHSSPMEHCAQCMTDTQYQNYTKVVNVSDLDEVEVEFGWCRNFKGFIPYRHIVETSKNN